MKVHYIFYGGYQVDEVDNVYFKKQGIQFWKDNHDGTEDEMNILYKDVCYISEVE